MTQPKSKVYLPETVPRDIRETVKDHLAEKFGGFTALEGQGAWMDQNGERLDEQTEVLEVFGMKASEAQSTANWVALHTDEDEVMWETLQVEGGFETGT